MERGFVIRVLKGKLGLQIRVTHFLAFPFVALRLRDENHWVSVSYIYLLRNVSQGLKFPAVNDLSPTRIENPSHSFFTLLG